MPELDRVVVVDTTPIIALAVIDQLGLLKDLYHTVVIPPSVEAEILAGDRDRPGVREFQEATWIQKIAPNNPRQIEEFTDLDQGEAEVIVLALELNADLVIIDERLARRQATRLGILVTGVLGVLLKAKADGKIQAVEPLIRLLRQSGIWLSDALVNEVLRLAREE